MEVRNIDQWMSCVETFKTIDVKVEDACHRTVKKLVETRKGNLTGETKTVETPILLRENNSGYSPGVQRWEIDPEHRGKKHTPNEDTIRLASRLLERSVYRKGTYYTNGEIMTNWRQI